MQTSVFLLSCVPTHGILTELGNAEFIIIEQTIRLQLPLHDFSAISDSTLIVKKQYKKLYF